MLRRWMIPLLASCLLALALEAKDERPRFKTIEIKHFALAEGVELPPEFSDFLYAEFKKELQKTKLFAQILGEGEVVEPADVSESVVLEGSVLEYKKGNVPLEVIVGFGAGSRHLKAQFVLKRRGTEQAILAEEVKTRSPATVNAKYLARSLAHEIASHIKKRLREQSAEQETAPSHN